MVIGVVPEPDDYPTEEHGVPPQDILAERAVLGAMLTAKDAITDAVDVITGRDFYRAAHELIFDAITALDGRGEPTDPAAVAAELTRNGDLGHAGGGAYILKLYGDAPAPASAAFHARTVRDRAVFRRLTQVGTKIKQIGQDGGDTTSAVDLAQSALDDVLGTQRVADFLTAGDTITTTLDGIEAAATRDGRVTGVPTGFADLDRLTAGLHPGQMVVVAGRPGMGKSTVGMDWVRSAAIRHGLPAAVFSLEMSRDEINLRLLSAEARVPLQNLRTGQMRPDDWERVNRRLAAIVDAPLYVDDDPNVTVAQIRAKCRRLKARRGLSLVVVDYLQLMTSGRKVESRQQEVSGLSRSLKLLAKELEVPVVAISQLNRGPEQRQDKRPMVADLRESGSIEQDSDVIILIHRDDMYEKESPRAGEADLIVAKHRNGPTDTITVAFQGHYSRFVDMADGPYGSDA